MRSTAAVILEAATICLLLVGDARAQSVVKSRVGDTTWVTQSGRLQRLATEVASLPDRSSGGRDARQVSVASDSAVRLASHSEIEGSRHREIDEPSLIAVGPSATLVRYVHQPSAGDAATTLNLLGADNSFTDNERIQVGVDLYSSPEFSQGLIIQGENVSMKIGGYVKADFIQDFDPIDSTDSFATTTIPVGAPPRTNSRFHARQTRLSFDTRWASNAQPIRIYVEGDFFSDKDRFRLRHAYGAVGSLLVGRTWTTFTDIAAAPATLDFEGSVSSINRRQALARWTQPVWCDWLTAAVAIEDTRFIIETPLGITGDARSPSPDFVANVRLDREWGKFQIAGLSRIVGFQPTGGDVITTPAWGFNCTGVILIAESTKGYYQIVFGEGIGSYRDLPDAAPSSLDSSQLLPLFGWMVGVTHEWNEQLSSNFTYAENKLDNTLYQVATDVRETTYLAANLIWRPLDRVSLGVEYLYGTRQNVDRSHAYANRLQASIIFDLP